MTVAVRDYLARRTPPTKENIVERYGLPSRLVATSANFMVDAGLLLRVVIDEKDEVYGFVPAVDAGLLTVGEVIKRVRGYGSSGFIPDFDRTFAGVIEVVDKAELAMIDSMSHTYVKDIPITDFVTVEADKAATSKTK